MSAAEAKHQVGVGKERVSRWRGKLADTVAYRAAQILAARRKGELEAKANHTDAPDLASLVIEGTLKLSDAIGALDAREAEERHRA